MEAQTAIEQANNTLAWLFLTLFVFAPLVVLFATIIVKLALRCPKCKSYKRAMVTKTTQVGDTINVRTMPACAGCGHEY